MISGIRSLFHEGFERKAHQRVCVSFGNVSNPRISTCFFVFETEVYLVFILEGTPFRHSAGEVTMIDHSHLLVMYGVLTYIYIVAFIVNVGKYTYQSHGSFMGRIWHGDGVAVP